MNTLDIEPHQDGDTGVIVHKTVTISGKQIDTPAKAIQISKSTRYAEVVEEARAVNEIHQQVDGQTIENSRLQSDDKIREGIKDGLKDAQGGELNIAFLSHQEETELRGSDIRWCVQVLNEYSDIIPTPLMPAIMRGATNDENEPVQETTEYENGLRNIKKFLRYAEELDVSTPLMGVLPVRYPWELNQQLLDLYIDAGIRAFCVNFDGKTVSAQEQIDDVVAPLVEDLTDRGLENASLLYAINAKPGNYTNGDVKSSKDFAALYHGFDVLGENHIPFRAPEHVFERIEKEQKNSPTTIDIFDKGEYVHRRCALSDIDTHFPSDSGVDLQKIKRELRKKDEPPYNIRAILNAEQMSQAARELRVSVQAGNVTDTLSEKGGVGEDEEKTMSQVRSRYEG